MSDPDHPESPVSARSARRIKTPRAEFDAHDHCIAVGWAPYHAPTWRQRLCRHRRINLPEPPNDYCPQAYKSCPTCHIAGHWYNIGTHRHGGINAYFAGLRP